jgi:hypothetical protein
MIHCQHSIQRSGWTQLQYSFSIAQSNEHAWHIWQSGLVLINLQKKGTSNVREALSLVINQVKILLDKLQMVDPSVIFLPHNAKDRVGVESDLIATAEHVNDNYDFTRKYFPQFYAHKHDTYMNSNVLMAFNKPQKELLWESSNILYGEHHAMYPRELQSENCVIVGSFLCSHRDIQGKRLIEFLSHLSGYHMTARWKAISTRPE